MPARRIPTAPALTAAVTAAALGFATLAGAGAAAAKPDPWDPWGPGPSPVRGHDNWPPGQQKKWDGWPDRDWYRFYDREPNWGWGPPPRAEWRGVLPPPWGPPPPPINYWGYQVNPIWDPGFNAWGFWLFGLFIPLVSIG